MSIGTRVASHDATPPELTQEEQAAKAKLLKQLMTKYRTEILGKA